MVAVLVLSVALALGALVLLLPVISECLSILRLPWARPVARVPAPDERPALLFLVPAHDEELLLPQCLASLSAQQYPAERRIVVVVADNCADRTADVAREAGTQVLVRRDPGQRGKPYAIAWALDQLDLERFDAVVIVDADTDVGPGFAAALAARAPLGDKVLQPFIDVQNPDDSALTRLAALYAQAVHGLAYRLKERVGLNVPLGVGMCIGTQVLRDHGWPAFSIGEDHELYAILTARGVRIEPAPAARITAQEAAGLQQSASQRHRWTAGRRQALLTCARSVIVSPHIGFSQRLDALAELTWFGPVVNLWLAVAGATLCWLLAPPGGGVLAALYMASLSRPVGYTLAALVVDRDRGTALRAFLYLPVYLVWRGAPALRSFLQGGVGPWVRTDRHAEPEKQH